MNHETFTEKLSLWLENELSAPEITELQAHLAGCPTCQQTYQALQRVETLLRGGSKIMVGPPPGFTTRFEVRLAYHQVRNGGHLWWGFGVLLLGALFLFIIGGLAVSALVSSGAGWLDGAIFYSGLVGLIQLANTLGVWLNLAGLFVKVSLITMSQPLFWGCVLAALGLAWLWLRVLKYVNRPVATSVELLI
ncbi:MAG: hypothetical protein Fur0044_16930 [Anaerolineae bacterium]|nr:zf-HC2 domain-containing protein [Anaerolineales bacterium]MCQ3975379.1 hypothetical protein [Anaerolineae bacterium]